MTIWKRLKNLWKLSEFEPSSPQKEKSANIGDKFAMIYKPKELEPHMMAQIIKLRPKDEIEEILKDNE